MSSTKKFTLKSSEGKIFEVDEAVALQSQTIKKMIEEDCPDREIPLSHAPSNSVLKVIEYCRKHVEPASSEDDLKAWDADFIKVDCDTFCGLIVAAFDLEIKNLQDLTCKFVENMLPGDETAKLLRMCFNFDPKLLSEY